MYEPKAPRGPGAHGKSLRGWKRYSPSDVSFFNAACGPLLARLGYDYEPPPKPFPSRPMDPEALGSGEGDGRDFVINGEQPGELRTGEERRFGREMTRWRKKHTRNDTRPFKTVEK